MNAPDIIYSLKRDLSYANIRGLTVSMLMCQLASRHADIACKVKRKVSV